MPFSLTDLLLYPARKARWLASPAQRRLQLALVLSLAAHTGVLSLQGGADAPQARQASPLEVVLVNSHTPHAPARAQVIAQQQVDGGGTDAQGHAQSPLPHTGAAAQTVILQALRERQLQLEQEQQRLLVLAEGAPLDAAEHPKASLWDRMGEPGDDAREQPAVLQNAQIAALRERIRQYNAQPRKHFFAPSASAAPYAQYVDDWRVRVETAGTQHFPPQARGRIYGSLRATVELRSDGSVLDVRIDRPSEHAVLNQAVRRIVQLAAPFPPFPPEMSRHTDVLSITRTWHFTNDTLDTQAP
ncbi:TonB family protein [Orrella sp. JC864]|uniref:energy transducer TonB n=1 Tax=Orrella sp. JC864 TaxID=3120298 RepID=UPI00300A5A1D